MLVCVCLCCTFQMLKSQDHRLSAKAAAALCNLCAESEPNRSVFDCLSVLIWGDHISTSQAVHSQHNFFLLLTKLLYDKISSATHLMHQPKLKLFMDLQGASNSWGCLAKAARNVKSPCRRCSIHAVGSSSVPMQSCSKSRLQNYNS